MIGGINITCNIQNIFENHAKEKHFFSIKHKFGKPMKLKHTEKDTLLLLLPLL